MNLTALYKKFAKRIEPIGSAEIKAIRKSYDLSQKSFAWLLNINLRTLQNYEIGHRIPSSPASALFRLAQKHPKVFLKRRLENMRRFFK